MKKGKRQRWAVPRESRTKRIVLEGNKKLQVQREKKSYGFYELKENHEGGQNGVIEIGGEEGDEGCSGEEI